MEKPASAEASITFDAARDDKRPAEGFGMVGLQRFAFVLPRASRIRQGFGGLLPKNVRVRVDVRMLRGIRRKIRVQQAELHGLWLAIKIHSR